MVGYEERQPWYQDTKVPSSLSVDRKVGYNSLKSRSPQRIALIFNPEYYQGVLTVVPQGSDSDDFLVV